jgi:hypothetical protein
LEVVRRIPSCFVDKALVQALEDFLRQRLEPLAGGDPDGKWVAVSIIHHMGGTTLRSISEHTRTTFADGTREIAIVGQVRGPAPLDVRLQFSVSRPDSFLSIRYSDDGARPLVSDLLAGVERIVAQRRSWNAWFCPEFRLASFVDGLAVGVVMFAVYAFTAGSRVPRWAIWTSLLLPAYRLIGFFKPYSTFATPEALTLRAVGNWLTAGIAGLVLLTAIGAYFDIEWDEVLARVRVFPR